MGGLKVEGEIRNRKIWILGEVVDPDLKSIREDVT
jgi:hypothetical protein